MRRLAAALIFTALTLTSACGGSNSSDGHTTPLLGDGAAKCSSLWVDGKKLPAKYDGCVDARGTSQLAAGIPCAHGADLVTYEPAGSTHGYFTLADRTIVDGGKDYADEPRYAKRYADCG